MKNIKLAYLHGSNGEVCALLLINSEGELVKDFVLGDYCCFKSAYKAAKEYCIDNKLNLLFPEVV